MFWKGNGQQQDLKRKTYSYEQARNYFSPDVLNGFRSVFYALKTRQKYTFFDRQIAGELGRSQELQMYSQQPSLQPGSDSGIPFPQLYWDNAFLPQEALGHAMVKQVLGHTDYDSHIVI